ncbi:MAG TPA: ABC transporter ATP-binding protein [Candidatus Binataceae bacterium]|nr:ABC transporter ATP-binding protein [Candidatus Binataceae bacterium]
MIEVQGLHVAHEETILERIDWRVERGQHWVILGANGSGKTSLLRTLTGYLPPTAGAISVLGQTYGRSDWRELRKRVGIVSSGVHDLMEDNEPALNAVLSGRFAQFGLWEPVTAAQRGEALRILRQVECAGLRQRPWRHLSQGERQRILIGRALMARPKLLILDEPCAGLDPVAREHFLRFLQRLARRSSGPTLVLVTHHTEEITPAFSHVLILKRGRVLAAGSKATTLTARRLAETFAAPVSLSRRQGRYYLSVKPADDFVT